MQRHLLGLITLALFLAAASAHRMAAGQTSIILLGDACFRLGILLAVLWLALPNVLRMVERLPAWLIGTTFAALAMMAVRPKTIFVVGPLLLAVWVLAPQWFGKRK
jgi:hypothetical protein